MAAPAQVVTAKAGRRARAFLVERPSLANRVTAARARLDRRGRRREPHRYEVRRLAATAPRRGAVLLSLLNEPFFLPEDEEIPHSHTNQWETRTIADTWRSLGFDVDVISWINDRFVPEIPYDVVVDARLNLERLDPLLPAGCVRVMHIDTSHWLFHQTEQHRRLLDLQRRRGVTLRLRKEVTANRAIEHADHAVMLGNDVTARTYEWAGTPLHALPISAPFLWDLDTDKDWSAARRRFLWFGSEAAVHKGLDLTLEAFAGLPDLQLDVGGPVEREPEFVAAYRQELFETPNIRLRGFLDVAGPEFTELRARTGSVVYPTCSEGQNGGVVTCLHGGLVPVTTPEVGIDVDPFARMLPSNPSVDDIRQAVLDVADRSPEELAAMAQAGWEHARKNHTRERYAEAYQEIAERILADGRTRTR
jgi:glycosyltransferase involved in cell wall biosynthesis